MFQLRGYIYCLKPFYVRLFSSRIYETFMINLNARSLERSVLTHMVCDINLTRNCTPNNRYMICIVMSVITYHKATR